MEEELDQDDIIRKRVDRKNSQHRGWKITGRIQKPKVGRKFNLSIINIGATIPATFARNIEKRAIHASSGLFDSVRGIVDFLLHTLQVYIQLKFKFLQYTLVICGITRVMNVFYF